MAPMTIPVTPQVRMVLGYRRAMPIPFMIFLMLVLVWTSRFTINSLPTILKTSDMAKNPMMAGTTCTPSAR